MYIKCYDTIIRSLSNNVDSVSANQIIDNVKTLDNLFIMYSGAKNNISAAWKYFLIIDILSRSWDIAVKAIATLKLLHRKAVIYRPSYIVRVHVEKTWFLPNHLCHEIELMILWSFVIVWIMTWQLILSLDIMHWTITFMIIQSCCLMMHLASHNSYESLVHITAHNIEYILIYQSQAHQI